MATWLYQLSPTNWNPNRFRFEIWEGERWTWSVGQKTGKDTVPEAGDVVVFFYSPTGGSEPGFYGWAIVLEWYPDSDTPLTFRPTAPTDFLKMHPWWDDAAKGLVDRIRGKVARKTLFLVSDNLAVEIRQGIIRWLAGAPQSEK